MSRHTLASARTHCNRIAAAVDALGSWDLGRRGDKELGLVAEVLAILTDAQLADLERKGRYRPIPDGWKPSVAAPPLELVHPGGSGLRTNPDDPLRRKREHGHADASSVEQSQMSRAEFREADPVGDVLRVIFSKLAEMATISETAVGDTTEARRLVHRLFVAARTVDRAYGYVENVRTKAAGRQSSLPGPCQCCGREVFGTEADQLRSGFCNACRMAWSRAGCPDRPPWIVVRRAWLAERDEAAS